MTTAPNAVALPVSLVETVTRHVRSQVLSGELEPGERIVEESLCAALGISRAPVREALRFGSGRPLGAPQRPALRRARDPNRAAAHDRIRVLRVTTRCVPRTPGRATGWPRSECGSSAPRSTGPAPVVDSEAAAID